MFSAAGGDAISVDGAISDWDLSKDFLYNMYEAGNNDGSKMLASKAYSRYDCDAKTVCVLVIAEPNVYFEQKDAWLKLYGLTNSAIPGTIDYVMDGSTTVGWEGCFPLESLLASGITSYYGEIEIHADYGETGGSSGRTTSTGRGDSLNKAAFGCCDGSMPAETVVVKGGGKP
jgi:hypothetical protein